MHLKNLSAAAAGLLAALLALPYGATAATYIVPIQISGNANGNIFKIVVDNGTIRRAGFKDGITFYEAEMEDGACSRTVNVLFSEPEIAPLQVPYDVCSEQGFGIGIERE